MPDLTRKQKSHALRVARKYVKIKISLESPFKRELRSYFSEQSARVRFGLPIETIEPVLDGHYKRIVFKITGLRIKQDDSVLEDRILLLLFGRAALRAEWIDKTTNKLLQRSITVATQTITESGGELTTRELNILTSRILQNYNKNRVGGIAVFETQALTEKIRDELTVIATEKMNIAIFEENRILAQEAADLAESIRLQEIADDVGDISAGELFLGLKLLEKTWVTMGDKRVRLWHQQANFQTVSVNAPFIVHRELLMYPGDMSLGASLDNVSGCRCVTVNM
jgi:hypothetical protein